MEERIHKILAHCGIGSRRECETIIEQGRVEINGKVVTKLGTKVDPGTDEIKVDGEKVALERKVYYLLNKPRGYVCTNSFERGAQRVVDLVREDRRIYTVGRLDEASEGLILITNDGSLTNIICHPRYQVDKTYRLTIPGPVERWQLDRIERGVWLSGGKTAPAHIRHVERKGNRTLVTATLWEGRNRELRRMFAKVDLKVSRLLRTAIGTLLMDGLPVGSYRRVDPSELGFAFERLQPDWRPKPVKPAKRRRAHGQERGQGRGRGRGQQGQQRDQGRRPSEGGRGPRRPARR